MKRRATSNRAHRRTSIKLSGKPRAPSVLLTDDPSAIATLPPWKADLALGSAPAVADAAAITAMRRTGSRKKAISAVDFLVVAACAIICVGL
jgi:hypothetical protein